MTDTLDLLETAKQELAGEMVPSPDDLLEDFTPLAQLYFTEQLVYELLARFTAALSDEPTDELDTSAGIGKALVAIAGAAGALDVAMIELGMLPADAKP